MNSARRGAGSGALDLAPGSAPGPRTGAGTPGSRTGAPGPRSGAGPSGRGTGRAVALCTEGPVDAEGWAAARAAGGTAGAWAAPSVRTAPAVVGASAVPGRVAGDGEVGPLAGALRAVAPEGASCAPRPGPAVSPAFRGVPLGDAGAEADGVEARAGRTLRWTGAVAEVSRPGLGAAAVLRATGAGLAWLRTGRGAGPDVGAGAPAVRAAAPRTAPVRVVRTGPVPARRAVGAGAGAGGAGAGGVAAGAGRPAGPAAPAARNASSPGIIGSAARCTGACGAGVSTGPGAKDPAAPSARAGPAPGSAVPGLDTENSGSASPDVSSTPGPRPAPSAGLCHVASRPANPASATPAGEPPRAR
ncbi:hypothetical protein [Streptomyces sp. NPDC088923]|uniref:hypothetical protein n=1 Tax=Streptomyces sp. NPDC088923 TaxID=3365913 RepID=UPI00380DEAF9